MKTTKSLIALFLSVLAIGFTACEPEEDVFGKPVVNEDFTVTVNQNTVTLTCTMKAATSVLWEVSTGDQSTQKTATVTIPIAGTYTVVLSVSNGGDYIASEAVEFVIETTDVTVFQTGIWKALTGGPDATKTWVLDVEKKYFHNPLDFYGDLEAGGTSDNIWGPWGGTSIFDWGGTPEEGEISFDAITGQVSITIDGTPMTGTYQLKPFDRPADFLMLTSGKTLWENMLTEKYAYLVTLSDQMADLKFASGLRFPMDRGRITNDDDETNPSQFLPEDLENVVIMHCSDSALVVRVKRTYEADGVSKCWLLYNYRVKEYTYPDKEALTPPIKADGTIAAGTYKLADVPANWIGWSTKDVLNAWADRAAFKQTMIEWWQFGDPAVETTATNADMAMTAISNVSLTFGSDGSVTVHNEKYADGAVTPSDVSTTYSISGGVVTFAAPISIYAVAASLNDISEAYVVDVASNTANNLWLGVTNGDKEETTAVQLVKQ